MEKSNSTKCRTLCLFEFNKLNQKEHAMKKNIINPYDDFDIDDIENPEWTEENFKNAISFSELPNDLQLILKKFKIKPLQIKNVK